MTRIVTLVSGDCSDVTAAIYATPQMAAGIVKVEQGKAATNHGNKNPSKQEPLVGNH